MKESYRISILALLLAALMAASGWAQGDQQQIREQSRMELERTAELIVQARMAVQSSGSVIAAQALERAEQLQEGALRAFDGQQYLWCVSLTRKAREQASLAISSSRMAEQLEGVLQGRLERAEEALERAREELQTPVNPTLSTLLDQARTFLAQAWEFYRQRQFRASAKLIEQVEQATRRLTNLSQWGQQAGDTFEYRLENVERLMEYTRDLVGECGSDSGREHLLQAEHALELARQLQSQNQPRAALAALGQAREGARKAARECRDRSRLEQRYERLLSELEALRERLQTGQQNVGSTRVEELARQAGEQLALAKRHLDENSVESAQLALQAAQIALRQAQRQLGGEF